MRHRRALVRVALVLGSLSFAACDRDYVYAPAVSSSASISGRPATFTPIPPEAPRGDVRVATFGIAGIHANGKDDDDEQRALHVRMIVANNSERPWSLDTREQRLVLPGHGESRAAYASTGQGSAPVLEIPPGGKREIDLFYPLPENLEKASKLPEFDFVWRVQTDSRLVAERTPFERLTIEPQPYGSAGYYGWGPPYWYDPYYSRGAFYGARIGGPAYMGPPVIHHRGYVHQTPAPLQQAPPAVQRAPPAR